MRPLGAHANERNLESQVSLQNKTKKKQNGNLEPNTTDLIIYILKNPKAQPEKMKVTFGGIEWELLHPKRSYGIFFGDLQEWIKSIFSLEIVYI